MQEDQFNPGTAQKSSTVTRGSITATAQARWQAHTGPGATHGADLRAQLPVIVGRYVHRADLYYDLYYRSPLACALARAIRIKYKIYLPARETPPPRCWVDTEIDSKVTMQSIPVPNQQIGGRLSGAHPVYTRVRVFSFTSREYLWENGRFNGSQRAYYGESAY